MEFRLALMVAFKLDDYILGLKLVKERCSELNIHFYLLNSTPKDLAKLCIKNDIGGIVCDFNPLRYIVKVQKILVDTLSGNIPVVQVDAHNIVPVWEASDKQEGMAKFIRPKITKKLPEYLTGFPEVCKHPYSDKFEVGDEEFENIDDAYGIYEPKWEVPPVKWGEGPGEKGGLEALRLFMVKNLSFYGVNSNDPSKDTTSQISPWLHFGHISAQRCALEELIIRKELSDNYCFYNENYDNTNGAANWAKETLKVHSKDKRIWVYSREQLEKAETHDEMWNAAQLQAVQDGKIHGYMRMYWCKKILEWTESPETAIAFSIWLNDTFCLDGTDPNGYVGIMWSICGVHDQGWKEREIFGKIRYMVDYSLRRKFDMDAYCSRFGRKISAETKKKTDKSGSSENKKKLGINKKGVKRKAI
ncbi:hypothetical protein NQ317_003262 [Molorchus minor]|uniref:Photolyase/cryptochrome alpha/beta domain-containing protein n=1 Tax=Molorchus minor TaxID=1323400 RepID=A0ABQ9JKM2_9CUCU|nr:hypothetical protein NQ317_003262 [Molorchus minor]